MDYNETLKTKYRPKSFSDMVGNDTNRKSFISHIKKVDADTFLLSGSRGCGKTSFSELMANFIIKKYKGNSLCLKEINVSVENGVNDARAIVAECSFSSTFHACSVYILNEVQRATKDWQEAMLEILEKVPQNTFFILCTTQPEKLDKAVLSRCTRYKFKELQEKEFLEFISDICEKEDINIDSQIKTKIFKSSFGIPREALSILGSIKNLKGDEISDYIESYEIETSEVPKIKDLVSELMNQSSMDKAFELLDSIKESPESIRIAIINYFYRIMVKPFGNEKKKEEMRLRASLILEVFKETVIYSGKPGLALSIYNYYS